MPKLVKAVSMRSVVGRRWRRSQALGILPYFSEITYSLPLSVASVNQAIYDG